MPPNLSAHSNQSAKPIPREAPIHHHGIIGQSEAILRVLAMMRKVSASDTTVLINGETGTGKGLAARAIHLESQRRESAFVAINCGAIPENLLESELFGHVRGAFTGATT
ncbi:MAG: sigma 54-interacting transcriptional regulator, partial [Desulfobacterales bacterium]|nr:sigma 54-interacting transcriptional regulator [Desulfobacterales bacterium]